MKIQGLSLAASFPTDSLQILTQFYCRFVASTKEDRPNTAARLPVWRKSDPAGVILYVMDERTTCMPDTVAKAPLYIY